MYDLVAWNNWYLRDIIRTRVVLLIINCRRKKTCEIVTFCHRFKIINYNIIQKFSSTKLEHKLTSNQFQVLTILQLLLPPQPTRRWSIMRRGNRHLFVPTWRPLRPPSRPSPARWTTGPRRRDWCWTSRSVCPHSCPHWSAYLILGVKQSAVENDKKHFVLAT